MTMYRVMLCFFFISNPNYRPCVSNGWQIVGLESGTESRGCGACPFRVPEPVRGHRHGEQGGHSIANAGHSFNFESMEVVRARVWGSSRLTGRGTFRADRRVDTLGLATEAAAGVTTQSIGFILPTSCLARHPPQ